MNRTSSKLICGRAGASESGSFAWPGCLKEGLRISLTEAGLFK